ncbi:MAG: hypothetical protein MUF38_12015, partial [Anaerolineae bacterium]|nr:hypothetical protein [Anaerolineae bacterium]
DALAERYIEGITARLPDVFPPGVPMPKPLRNPRRLVGRGVLDEGCSVIGRVLSDEMRYKYHILDNVINLSLLTCFHQTFSYLCFSCIRPIR